MQTISLKKLDPDALLVTPDRLREGGWPAGVVEAADLGTLPPGEQGYLRWASKEQAHALQRVLHHRHCYVRYTVTARRYVRGRPVERPIPDRIVVVFQRPVVLAVLSLLRVANPERHVKSLDEKDIAVLKWGETVKPLWVLENMGR